MNIFSIILMMIYTAGCSKQPENSGTGTIHIQFVHKAGSRDFSLNTNYTNNSGEQFAVTKFKYYISNIRLNNTAAATETYFLVDESDPSSKNIAASFKTGPYTSVSFLLGVDSLHNVSGAQSGALDPLNGMFWTWNSGYIMAKMEGISPVSPLQANIFEYHIGGFSGANNVLRRITLLFPANRTYALKKDKAITVTINTDILEWFKTPSDLSIAVTPSCTTPGAMAKKVADNYADMFSIVSVNE